MGDSGRSSPAISLPPGGGAVRGLGEKFAPDLHTGTGNFAIPLQLPAGRTGFQPDLSLRYSTGRGNSAFGLGWELGVPGVARKTSDGVPRYDEHDVFVLSGAEDLVRIEALDLATMRYRPRTEGLFARILHRRDGTNSYWEVTGRDGLVSLYGTPGMFGSDPAVIADPADRRKAFAWHLTRTVDTFGNRIEYEYERDSGQEGSRQWDQLYLKRIRYGDYVVGNVTKFLVSVEIEYEARPHDAFSHYRAGFEIRTRWRCKRILVRTHADVERLLRSYELRYMDQREELQSALPANGVSLLSTVTTIGHDGSATEVLPPLELSYTSFAPAHRKFIPLRGDLPTRSLSHADLALVDLFGQGLPDILEMNGTGRYWRNVGGTFEPPRLMSEAPAGLKLGDSDVRLIDADGDGRTELLIGRSALSGYFPLRFDGRWDQRSFRRYRQAPSFDIDDPQLRFVDLNGDGVIDAVKFGATIEYFFNDPLQGWREARDVRRAALDGFPNVTLTDPRVRWADMSGDGLQDIVLVHDASIEYWPNLGHGNWGARVRMTQSPRFPFRYDPGRVLLGDIDGDGLADLVYVEDTKVTLWINRAGNGWSEPIEILGTPPLSLLDSVRLADMLGTGVPGLLWSSDRGSHGRDPLLFLDFTGGRKPYLLNGTDNHVGATTRIEYAPSTRFFLDDQKKRATRWVTTLPFPVQVVARVEVLDALSGGKLTSEYRYHNGYWDGAEREFHGFAMVEQLDSESFERYDRPGLHGEGAFFRQVDRKYFSPPTLTRTWFHQGAIGDEFGDWREFDWSSQYWKGDPPVLGHTESVNAFLKTLPTAWNSRRTKRDALRALRGGVLRSEVYALDGSLREESPYTVTEIAYGLREESKSEPGSDRRRVFFPHAVAHRTTQWERGSDPLTSFSFTDDYDVFGQPRLQTDVACPRGWRFAGDRPANGFLATCTVTSYAAPTDPDTYIRDRVCGSVGYEIAATAGKTIAEIHAGAVAGDDLTVIAHSVQFYDGLAFEGLPFGQVGRFGALVRTEALAMTDAQVTEAFGAARPPYLATDVEVVWPASYPAEFTSLLPPRAGYVLRSAAPYTPGFYVASLRRAYDFQPSGVGRGLIVTTRDPLGADTTATYDAPYQVLPATITDPFGMQTVAVQDYRVLQPKRVVDPNGHATDVTFTPLGLPKEIFVRGRDGEGDQAKPSVSVDYGIHAFEQSTPENRKPVFARTRRRMHHESEDDVPPDERDTVVESCSYFDGFGRTLQVRSQVDDLLYGDPLLGTGALPINQLLPPADLVGRRRAPGSPPNVLVSGAQVFDNKGRVVEAFEPFYSTGFEFTSPEAESIRLGQSVLGNRAATFYDAMGRAIHTINSDGSEQRVVTGVPGTIASPDLGDPSIFEPTPWESYSYDANDNAGRTHVIESQGYRHCWNTPASVRIDALGRTVESVARNKETAGAPIEEVRTVSTYDIGGNVLTVTDSLGRVVMRYVYDCAQRRLRLEGLDCGVRTTAYDAIGQKIEHRDAKGAWILTVYDRMHRESRLWARDAAVQSLTLRVRTEYGDGGTATQHAGERAAQRAANRLGKVFRQYDEAGLVTFDRYDFKGNVTDKARQVIRDDLVVAAFRADWHPPAGTTFAEHATAQLDATRYETSAKYDALSRVASLTSPGDVMGNRHTIVPRYNKAGAIERVTLDDDMYVEHIAYNSKGQRSLIVYGNGLATAYAHDPRSLRLRRTWTGRFTRTGAADAPTWHPIDTGQPSQDLAYDQDLIGNVLRIADRTPGCGVINTAAGRDALDHLFRYDALYRLRAANGRESSAIPSPRPWGDEHRTGFDSGNHGTPNQDSAPQLTRPYTEEYEYDAAGNLASLRHATGASAWVRRFELDGPTNRLTRVSDNPLPQPQTHFFDANGNLIRETTSRHFGWDHDDRLTSFRIQAGAAEPSLQTFYLYDVTGQRVKKVIRTQGGALRVTIFVDGLLEHHRRVEGNTIRENNSLHVLETQKRVAVVRVGVPFENDHAPAVAYHLGDARCANVTVDDTGGWTNREEYSPFGETTFGGFARKRFRYSGKERDEDTGFYYHGLRYYAPWLCRWTSCDPLSLAGGLNLYSFVSNNPITLQDPHGTEDHADDYLDAGAPTPTDKKEEVHLETPDQAAENNARLVPGGAAEPDKARQGYAKYDTNQHADAYAARESKKGMKAGAVNFVANAVDGAMTVSGAKLILLAKGSDPNLFSKAIKSLGPECDTDLCSNVADATEAGLSLTSLAVSEVTSELRAAAALRKSMTASLRVDPFAMKSAAPVVTEAESLSALSAEANGGTRIWVVGPEGAQTTRAIRFNGNRITYDTAAPAGKAARADMEVIMNNTGTRADWWTGTHGTPAGEFGPGHYEYRFIRQDRAVGPYRGFDVKNVYQQPRSLVLAPPTRPTVYSWCYSSSCFQLRQPALLSAPKMLPP